MTADGTVSEELLKRTLNQTVTRLGLKEAPASFLKVFDYSLTRKIRADLEAEGSRRIASYLGKTGAQKIEHPCIARIAQGETKGSATPNVKPATIGSTAAN